MSKCPSCGRQFKDKDAFFSLTVGNGSRLQGLQAKQEKSAFPIAGGILMMIAGCLLAFYGIIGVLASYFNIHRSDYYPSLVMGVSGLIGGFLSLGGGAEAFRRKSWALSLISAVLALIAELVHLITYGLMSPHGNIIAGLFVTLPIIVISLLGLILVASSKAAFTQRSSAP